MVRQWEAVLLTYASACDAMTSVTDVNTARFTWREGKHDYGTKTGAFRQFWQRKRPAGDSQGRERGAAVFRRAAGELCVQQAGQRRLPSLLLSVRKARFPWPSCCSWRAVRTQCVYFLHAHSKTYGIQCNITCWRRCLPAANGFHYRLKTQYVLKVRSRWQYCSGVVFRGDAVHRSGIRLKPLTHEVITLIILL